MLWLVFLSMDRFWSSYENFDGPASPNLRGYLKTAGNAFFESTAPINRKQVSEIMDTLFEYPDLRFIKIKTPNLKKAFGSTVEAEDYLKKLVDRS